MKGTYVLVIELVEPVSIATRGRLNFRLEPGYYFYIGSAMGAGGIEARVKRHLRKRKRLFWHIDYLTASEAARIIGYYEIASDKSLETEIARMLGAVLIPIEKFGSSDDKYSYSHLFYCKYGREVCINAIEENLARLNTPVKFKSIDKPSS
ncbi:GIY-YIG nuclease family protein [Thermogladius sp. 4427co]|uniref:GIY-YIG nuclease family protein n=1 Tax=Thermogladius sp. 4427co TaxID=3450718 RepID=UPI003F79291D